MSKKKPKEDKPRAEPEQLGETVIGQPDEVPPTEQHEQEAAAAEEPAEPPAHRIVDAATGEAFTEEEWAQRPAWVELEDGTRIDLQLAIEKGLVEDMRTKEAPDARTEPTAAELLEQLPEMAAEIRAAIGDNLVAAAEAESDVALDILVTMHLEPEHILSGRALEDGRVRLVTKGGRKLTFPDDVERARKLTPSERTGEPNSNAKDFKERLADHAKERDEE